MKGLELAFVFLSIASTAGAQTEGLMGGGGPPERVECISAAEWAAAQRAVETWCADSLLAESAQDGTLTSVEVLRAIDALAGGQGSNPEHSHAVARAVDQNARLRSALTGEARSLVESLKRATNILGG